MQNLNGLFNGGTNFDNLTNDDITLLVAEQRDIDASAKLYSGAQNGEFFYNEETRQYYKDKEMKELVYTVGDFTRIATEDIEIKNDALSSLKAAYENEDPGEFYNEQLGYFRKIISDKNFSGNIGDIQKLSASETITQKQADTFNAIVDSYTRKYLPQLGAALVSSIEDDVKYNSKFIADNLNGGAADYTIVNDDGSTSTVKAVVSGDGTHITNNEKGKNFRVIYNSHESKRIGSAIDRIRKYCSSNGGSDDVANAAIAYALGGISEREKEAFRNKYPGIAKAADEITFEEVNVGVRFDIEKPTKNAVSEQIGTKDIWQTYQSLDPNIPSQISAGDSVRVPVTFEEFLAQQKEEAKNKKTLAQSVWSDFGATTSFIARAKEQMKQVGSGKGGTPEDYKGLGKKGFGAGFRETVTDLGNIPVLGIIIDAGAAAGVESAAIRYSEYTKWKNSDPESYNGKPGDPYLRLLNNEKIKGLKKEDQINEIEKIRSFDKELMDALKEAQMAAIVRGENKLAYTIGQITTGSLSFMAEIATTRGAAGAVKSSFRSAMKGVAKNKLTASERLGRTVEQARIARSKAYEVAAAKGLKGVDVKTFVDRRTSRYFALNQRLAFDEFKTFALEAAPLIPLRGVSTGLEISMQSNVEVGVNSDGGLDVTYEHNKNILDALIQGVATTASEVLSEGMGSLASASIGRGLYATSKIPYIGRAVNTAAAPVKIAGKVARAIYSKLPASTRRVLSKAGYNGYLEEIGEEFINDTMNAAMGFDDDAPIYERLMNVFDYSHEDNLNKWASMAISFAITPTVVAGVNALAVMQENRWIRNAEKMAKAYRARTPDFKGSDQDAIAEYLVDETIKKNKDIRVVSNEEYEKILDEEKEIPENVYTREDLKQKVTADFLRARFGSEIFDGDATSADVIRHGYELYAWEKIKADNPDKSGLELEMLFNKERTEERLKPFLGDSYQIDDESNEFNKTEEVKKIIEDIALTSSPSTQKRRLQDLRLSGLVYYIRKQAEEALAKQKTEADTESKEEQTQTQTEIVDSEEQTTTPTETVDSEEQASYRSMPVNMFYNATQREIEAELQKFKNGKYRIYYTNFRVETDGLGRKKFKIKGRPVSVNKVARGIVKGVIKRKERIERDAENILSIINDIETMDVGTQQVVEGQVRQEKINEGTVDGLVDNKEFSTNETSPALPDVNSVVSGVADAAESTQKKINDAVALAETITAAKAEYNTKITPSPNRSVEEQIEIIKDLEGLYFDAKEVDKKYLTEDQQTIISVLESVFREITGDKKHEIVVVSGIEKYANGFTGAGKNIYVGSHMIGQVINQSEMDGFVWVTGHEWFHSLISRKETRGVAKSLMRSVGRKIKTNNGLLEKYEAAINIYKNKKGYKDSSEQVFKNRVLEEVTADEIGNWFVDRMNLIRNIGNNKAALSDAEKFIGEVTDKLNLEPEQNISKHLKEYRDGLIDLKKMIGYAVTSRFSKAENMTEVKPVGQEVVAQAQSAQTPPAQAVTPETTTPEAKTEPNVSPTQEQKKETQPEQKEETQPEQKEETQPEQKEETQPEQKEETQPEQKEETQPEQKEETQPEQKEEKKEAVQEPAKQEEKAEQTEENTPPAANETQDQIEVNALLLENIGDLFSAMGDKEKAQHYWEQALQSNTAINPDAIKKKIAKVSAVKETAPKKTDTESKKNDKVQSPIASETQVKTDTETESKTEEKVSTEKTEPPAVEQAQPDTAQKKETKEQKKQKAEPTDKDKQKVNEAENKVQPATEPKQETQGEIDEKGKKKLVNQSSLVTLLSTRSDAQKEEILKDIDGLGFKIEEVSRDAMETDKGLLLGAIEESLKKYATGSASVEIIVYKTNDSAPAFTGTTGKYIYINEKAFEDEWRAATLTGHEWFHALTRKKETEYLARQIIAKVKRKIEGANENDLIKKHFNQLVENYKKRYGKDAAKKAYAEFAANEVGRWFVNATSIERNTEGLRDKEKLYKTLQTFINRIEANLWGSTENSGNSHLIDEYITMIGDIHKEVDELLDFLQYSDNERKIINELRDKSVSKELAKKLQGIIIGYIRSAKSDSVFTEKFNNENLSLESILSDERISNAVDKITTLRGKKQQQELNDALNTLRYNRRWVNMFSEKSNTLNNVARFLSGNSAWSSLFEIFERMEGDYGKVKRFFATIVAVAYNKNHPEQKTEKPIDTTKTQEVAENNEPAVNTQVTSGMPADDIKAFNDRFGNSANSLRGYAEFMLDILNAKSAGQMIDAMYVFAHTANYHGNDMDLLFELSKHFIEEGNYDVVPVLLALINNNHKNTNTKKAYSLVSVDRKNKNISPLISAVGKKIKTLNAPFSQKTKDRIVSEIGDTRVTGGKKQILEKARESGGVKDSSDPVPGSVSDYIEKTFGNIKENVNKETVGDESFLADVQSAIIENDAEKFQAGIISALENEAFRKSISYSANWGGTYNSNAGAYVAPIITRNTYVFFKNISSGSYSKEVVSELGNLARSHEAAEKSQHYSLNEEIAGKEGEIGTYQDNLVDENQVLPSDFEKIGDAETTRARYATEMFRKIRRVIINSLTKNDLIKKIPDASGLYNDIFNMEEKDFQELTGKEPAKVLYDFLLGAAGNASAKERAYNTIGTILNKLIAERKNISRNDYLSISRTFKDNFNDVITEIEADGLLDGVNSINTDRYIDALVNRIGRITLKEATEEKAKTEKLLSDMIDKITSSKSKNEHASDSIIDDTYISFNDGKIYGAEGEITKEKLVSNIIDNIISRKSASARSRSKAKATDGSQLKTIDNIVDENGKTLRKMVDDKSEIEVTYRKGSKSITRKFVGFYEYTEGDNDSGFSVKVDTSKVWVSNSDLVDVANITSVKEIAQKEEKQHTEPAATKAKSGIEMWYIPDGEFNKTSPAFSEDGVDNGRGYGIYATSSKAKARGKNAYRIELSKENPVLINWDAEMPDTQKKMILSAEDKLKSEGHKEETINAVMQIADSGQKGSIIYNRISRLFDKTSNKSGSEAFRKMGFDGIVYKNKNNMEEYVVFGDFKAEPANIEAKTSVVDESALETDDTERNYKTIKLSAADNILLETVNAGDNRQHIYTVGAPKAEVRNFKYTSNGKGKEFSAYGFNAHLTLGGSIMTQILADYAKTPYTLTLDGVKIEFNDDRYDTLLTVAIKMDRMDFDENKNGADIGNLMRSVGLEPGDAKLVSYEIDPIYTILRAINAEHANTVGEIEDVKRSILSALDDYMQLPSTYEPVLSANKAKKIIESIKTKKELDDLLYKTANIKASLHPLDQLVYMPTIKAPPFIRDTFFATLNEQGIDIEENILHGNPSFFDLYSEYAQKVGQKKLSELLYKAGIKGFVYNYGKSGAQNVFLFSKKEIVDNKRNITASIPSFVDDYKKFAALYNQTIIINNSDFIKMLSSEKNDKRAEDLRMAYQAARYMGKLLGKKVIFYYQPSYVGGIANFTSNQKVIAVNITHLGAENILESVTHEWFHSAYRSGGRTEAATDLLIRETIDLIRRNPDAEKWFKENNQIYGFRGDEPDAVEEFAARLVGALVSDSVEGHRILSDVLDKIKEKTKGNKEGESLFKRIISILYEIIKRTTALINKLFDVWENTKYRDELERIERDLDNFKQILTSAMAESVVENNTHNQADPHVYTSDHYDLLESVRDTSNIRYTGTDTYLPDTYREQKNKDYPAELLDWLFSNRNDIEKFVGKIDEGSIETYDDVVEFTATRDDNDTTGDVFRIQWIGGVWGHGVVFWDHTNTPSLMLYKNRKYRRGTTFGTWSKNPVWSPSIKQTDESSSDEYIRLSALTPEQEKAQAEAINEAKRDVTKNKKTLKAIKEALGFVLKPRKGDLSALDLVFNFATQTREKSKVAADVYDAAERYKINKLQMLRDANTVEVNGETVTAMEYFEEIRKNNKDLYDRATKYIYDRDEKKDGFTVKKVQDDDGKPLGKRVFYLIPNGYENMGETEKANRKIVFDTPADAMREKRKYPELYEGVMPVGIWEGRRYYIHDGKNNKGMFEEFESEAEALEVVCQLTAKRILEENKGDTDLAKFVNVYQKMMFNGYNILADQLDHFRDIIISHGEDADSTNKEELKDLYQTYSEMGDLIGTYMPRVRVGEYYLVGTDKDGRKVRLPYKNRFAAAADYVILKRQGYRLQPEASSKLATSNLLATSMSNMNNIIHEATNRLKDERKFSFESFGVSVFNENSEETGRMLRFYVKRSNDPSARATYRYFMDYGKDMERKDWSFYIPVENEEDAERIKKNILEGLISVNDAYSSEYKLQSEFIDIMKKMLLERSSRATMLGREDAVGDDVVEGYEKDPIEAAKTYFSGVISGSCRTKFASEYIEAIDGRAYTEDKFRADFPESRNLEKGDFIELYREEAEKHRLRPTEQPNLAKEVNSVYETIMSTPGTLERVSSAINGIAALYFLSRPASAIINLSALATNVPSELSEATGADYDEIMKLIISFSKDYYKYRRERAKGNVMQASGLPIKEALLFEKIIRNQWDNNTLTSQILAKTESTLGKLWTTGQKGLFFMFNETERVSRAASIMTAYTLLSRYGKGRATTEKEIDDILFQAKILTDRALGNYEKWAQPAAFRGVLGKALSPMLLFTTFVRNMYAENFMRRKMNKHALKFYLLTSLIGGAKAIGITAIAGLIANLIGAIPAGEDPEEYLIKQAALIFGEEGETAYNIADTFMRTGALGFTGVDASGSLNMYDWMMFPTSAEGIAKKYFGAPGSIFMTAANTPKVWEKNKLMAIEGVTPAVVSSVIKAIREHQYGIALRDGEIILDEATGMPIKLGDGRQWYASLEFWQRAFGFNPKRIARYREDMWNTKSRRRSFTEMKTDLLSRARLLLANDVPTGTVEWNELLREIDEFNQLVITRKDPHITGITESTLNKVFKEHAESRALKKPEDIKADIEKRIMKRDERLNGFNATDYDYSERHNERRPTPVFANPLTGKKHRVRINRRKNSTPF